MLKKLRQKFILSAMLASFLVMLVLISAINLLDWHEVRRSQDEQLRAILAYEQTAAPRSGKRPINEMPWAGGKEREFTSRFFVVRCDAEGEVSSFGKDFIFSVDAGTAEAYAKTVLETGKETGRVGDYRYRVASQDGETTIVFLNVLEAAKHQQTLLGVSLLMGALSLLGMFALVVPLSKLAMRPYQKNLEMQKRFITDAGHELKTPITSIATSADIAAMEHEGDEWIANIQSQTSRLTRLVNDLVTLSRLDEEAPFPELSAFSLSELSWEAVESFQARAKAEEKSLKTAIQEGVEMHGDRDAIRKLLTILLDNALKYAPSGAEIGYTLSRKHGKIQIEVRNPCERDLSLDAERLFDRFYRPDESRSTQTGGTGIGLSIAKAIVDNHRGEIRVCTEEKGFVSFKVTL